VEKNVKWLRAIAIAAILFSHFQLRLKIMQVGHLSLSHIQGSGVVRPSTQKKFAQPLIYFYSAGSKATW